MTHACWQSAQGKHSFNVNGFKHRHVAGVHCKQGQKWGQQGTAARMVAERPRRLLLNSRGELSRESMRSSDLEKRHVPASQDLPYYVYDKGHLSLSVNATVTRSINPWSARQQQKLEPQPCSKCHGCVWTCQQSPEDICMLSENKEDQGPTNQNFEALIQSKCWSLALRLPSGRVTDEELNARQQGPGSAGC